MRSAAILHAVLFAALVHSAPAAFAAEGHLVLGGEDEGDGMLFYPRQAEEGPDGNLYVLDAADSFIKVYSPAGDYLRRMAGQGEGPGEFQRTDGATFGFTAAGQLYFTEFIGGHHWITIMDLDGDLARVVSPQLDVGFGIEAAWPRGDGGFLVQFAFGSTPRAKDDYFLYDTPRALVHIDSTGAVVSEIVRTDVTRLISYSPDGATTNLPFVPVFVWVVAAGEVIWSDGMSPRLRVLDPSGQTVREIETPLPAPESVTGEDLRQWRTDREELMKSRNPVWWDRFGRVVVEYDRPLYDKPILRDISLTPGGHLLVECPSYSETGESIAYWLLDARGEALSRVAAVAWNARLSGRYLLYFTRDDEGNTLVHAVDRPADEAEALALLQAVAESGEN